MNAFFQIPFEPEVLGFKLPTHLIMEYLAFFVAFRYYLYLKARYQDLIPQQNRLSIILGAIIGALIGSRLFGYLENPVMLNDSVQLIELFNVKTIMGGLFGGLLGVELSKKLIGESHSSGDLFTLPIIVGIIIGRVGCFLNGTNEFTYGMQTDFFLGMNLGDHVPRHPVALYEITFLILLFILLKKYFDEGHWTNGMIFRLFMIVYFGFRFMIEFVKPNVFFIAGLSSIQWLCILCWVYYSQTLFKIAKHAYQKVYIL